VIAEGLASRILAISNLLSTKAASKTPEDICCTK
jgi:hypothetical protein